jgi:DNA helicase HerA-like ATPase
MTSDTRGLPKPPTTRDVSALTETPVGTVACPGNGPSEFEFISPGDQGLRTGEFVAYNATVAGEQEAILARVTNTAQERGLPGEFLANPDVDPAEVAGALGVPTEDTELSRFTARTIGYFDEQISTFTNPRIQPQPGTRLQLAADAYLEAVLPNADWNSESGTAHLGWLLNRPHGAANIHVPIDTFVATHLAILASTGSGKSYTASVLIEEMMRPASRAAMLVFDPHAEYDTLPEMRLDEDSHVFEGDDGYRPEVEIITPDEITIPIPDLTYSDLLALLDGPSDRMRYVLNEAWQDLTDESNHITPQDIINKCEMIEGERSGTVDALAWRLNKSLNRDLFVPAARDDLTDLVAPGQVTVLKLNRLSQSDQQMLAAALLRKLYEARKAATRGEDDAIDHPVFSLFEEGHRFAPDGEARSLGILRRILSEGRKFGFGVGIISQRPSKIDPDVLSQCGTQIIMQIQNPTDQQAIRTSVESAGEDVLDELPGLTPGQAVVAGDAMNTPVVVNVRERHTEHGADSPEATKQWKTAHDRLETEPAGVTDAYDDGGNVDETPL